MPALLWGSIYKCITKAERARLEPNPVKIANRLGYK
jgi:hypothetical protein